MLPLLSIDCRPAFRVVQVRSFLAGSQGFDCLNLPRLLHQAMTLMVGLQGTQSPEELEAEGGFTQGIWPSNALATGSGGGLGGGGAGA